jgi:hypothetical protein
MNTQQVSLNVCFDIMVDVTNDGSERQQRIDANFAITKWLKQELIVPDDTNKLGIHGGYGEFEIYNLDNINAEVM